MSIDLNLFTTKSCGHCQVEVGHVNGGARVRSMLEAHGLTVWDFAEMSATDALIMLEQTPQARQLSEAEQDELSWVKQVLRDGGNAVVRVY